MNFLRNALRDDGARIEVEIEVIDWGSPSRPMRVEIVDAWLFAEGDKGPPRVELTDAERNRIKAAFVQHPPHREDDHG
jgi:hypothetical protein